jgi:hypothetical protein
MVNSLFNICVANIKNDKSKKGLKESNIPKYATHKVICHKKHPKKRRLNLCSSTKFDHYYDGEDSVCVKLPIVWINGLSPSTFGLRGGKYGNLDTITAFKFDFRDKSKYRIYSYRLDMIKDRVLIYSTVKNVSNFTKEEKNIFLSLKEFDILQFSEVKCLKNDSIIVNIPCRSYIFGGGDEINYLEKKKKFKHWYKKQNIINCEPCAVDQTPE